MEERMEQNTMCSQRMLSGTGVYFGVRVPAKHDTRQGTEWKWHEVAWSTSERTIKDDRPGIVGDYYSTLHYGHIPGDLLELCQQFLLTITKEWQEGCDNVFRALSAKVSHLNCVSPEAKGRQGQWFKVKKCQGKANFQMQRQIQIEGMGRNKEFIRLLASNAEILSTLRLYHRVQVKSAGKFATDISNHFPNSRDFVNGLLEDFSKGVVGDLDHLDQTLRDMLQLVSLYLSRVHVTTRLVTHGRNLLGYLSTRPITRQAWAPA